MIKKILDEQIERAAPTPIDKVMDNLQAMGKAHYFSQDARLLQETDVFLREGVALIWVLLKNLRDRAKNDPSALQEIEKAASKLKSMK